MDRLELVLRQDLGRPVAHPGLGPRPLGRQPAPLVALTATGATATRAALGVDLLGHAYDPERSSQVVLSWV